MKTMKRIASILLAVTLVFGMLTVPASAAGSTSARETKAQALSALGLFKGYDDTGTNFGLNNRATREHALLFLIRMLGEESAAAAWTGSQPYTDVPSGNYYYSYIGYAKEKGYTVGIGNNKFGLGRYANMKEMTTFALRGLGYSDASGIKDFTVSNSLTFAVSKGILDSDTAISPFTRGEAVDIIFGSIGANIKNQDYDLLSKLMNKGSVTQTQYDKAMAIVGGTATTTPTTTAALADGTYTMGCMGNAIRVTSGKLELRNTTPKQVFTVTNKTGYAYIQAEDGKYLSLSSVKNGAQLVTSSSAYKWVLAKQSGGAYTIRPYVNTSYVVNACEEKSANGTTVIIWAHSNAPKNTLITFTAATAGKSVTSVKLDQTTATVQVGKTLQLTGTITPSTATNQSVTWSSGNSAVATVNSSGVVTGVKAGTATITVKTADGGKTATCKVTVTTAAADQYTDKKVNLYNSTKQDVTDIRISSTQNKDWGNNLTSGTVKPDASVTILVPVSSTDYTYDILITYKDGSSATFSGYNFKSFTSGGSLYAYIDNGTPILSTTKPGAAAPDTSAESKTLTDRFNKALDRYNALVTEINKLDALKNNSDFAKSMNSVSSALTDMGKVIGQGTGVYTSEQIAQYNSALDALDSLMKELDALVAQAKAEASKPASRTVQVTFTNSTTADFIGFKASVTGGGGSSPETLKSGASITLEFTIANTTTPFTVSFTEGINNQPYSMDFTFDKSIQDGAALTVQFNVDDAGNVVYTQS
ncbi:MAG: Ig-like domain-containing protein [Oscillibacter ruminantium]|uniref:Ig-like domain-containing protein n=1 Tax=Oscillibacter ruminantium TaxID=1263547 RepID=UPI002B204419|nr:Ig-like domain-containing protein [Oscillibacter ruminantium]MEA5041861.1 Ig-like domain-containing protein [Oscillibacter ruminantium]